MRERFFQSKEEKTIGYTLDKFQAQVLDNINHFPSLVDAQKVDTVGVLFELTRALEEVSWRGIEHDE
jgi:hypothetical protein